MNGTNNTNVTQLHAWETVQPLINGYARVMRFSQRNAEDPYVLKYGNLSLDQMYEGAMTNGKPNGFGRDFRSNSDDDESYSWQYGFFKDSFDIEGRGRLVHYYVENKVA